MHGLLEDSTNRALHIAEFCSQHQPDATVVLCPPATMLGHVGEIIQHSDAKLGGQNAHSKEEGAFTGCISAGMLRDIGCDYQLVGHSERRAYEHEDDQMVARKVTTAHNNDLITIICIGETDEQRQAKRTIEVIDRQLEHSFPKCCTPENTIIAYEPVWAIGSGVTPSNEDIAVVHAHINANKEGYKVLYGGSVKPENAEEILSIPSVDGVLIGGASLDAAAFTTIIQLAVNV